jgi:hypothetical protein
VLTYLSSLGAQSLSNLGLAMLRVPHEFGPVIVAQLATARSHTAMTP